MLAEIKSWYVFFGAAALWLGYLAYIFIRTPSPNSQSGRGSEPEEL